MALEAATGQRLMRLMRPPQLLLLRQAGASVALIAEDNVLLPAASPIGTASLCMMTTVILPAA
jgi:hypothetical protein